MSRRLPRRGLDKKIDNFLPNQLASGIVFQKFCDKADLHFFRAVDWRLRRSPVGKRLGNGAASD
jgi:hypothetical protein